MGVLLIAGKLLQKRKDYPLMDSLSSAVNTANFEVRYTVSHNITPLVIGLWIRQLSERVTKDCAYTYTVWSCHHNITTLGKCQGFFLALFKKVFVRSSVYLQLQAVKAVQNEFYCIIATLQNTPTSCMFSALGSQLLQKTHFV